MANIENGKLSDFKPQTENANRHTQEGLTALSNAYSEVGYVAPMTAAANGEVIDGSARLEKATGKFGDDVLVIRHDGTKPIVMVREDVETADDPKAKRISYGANRIGELSLNWDPDKIIADLESGVDLSGLFDESELDNVLGDVNFSPEDIEITEPRDKNNNAKMVCCPNCGVEFEA